MKIAIIGSGAWGTAMAVHCAEMGNDVYLWSFLEQEAADIAKDREHKKLLPGVHIPESVVITTDIAACINDAELIILATPSFAVAETAEKMCPHIKDGQIVVSLSKGLDSSNNYCVFSETIGKILGEKAKIVALTGPSHAEEVSRGIPTTILAACPNLEACTKVQDILMNDKLRIYTSPDIIGAQLGGAMKNIIAIAAGISDGMGYGDNTKAALITRGLTEIAHLGVALGGKKETFAGLSGMGDLIVTCNSIHSRNYRAGKLIGEGVPVDEAMKKVGAVVEGYYATLAGHSLAEKLGISMPICESLYNVLYKNGDEKEAVHSLMTRAKRHESEVNWLDYKD